MKPNCLNTFFLYVVLTGLLILSHGCKQTSTTKPPNIVFILADDLGWADLPSYGNRFNEAPNLDQLAREGKLFNNAYAASPVCSPTRASIMSGQYPARTGIIDFIRGHWRPFEKVIPPANRTQFLPGEITTIGEILKTAGYKTGYFGKWHLGNGEGHHPSEQGFDEAFVYNGGGFYHPRFIPPADNTSGKRLSEILTDFSIDFIEKNKDSTFFLFLAHYDVHVQLDADSVLIEKYLQKEHVDGYPCNAVYAAMIEHLDYSVGRIVSKLDKLGISENTMVIFFSDNGGLVNRFDKKPLIAEPKRHFYENDTLLYIASSNAPLRAEKGTVFEGGVREPLIIKWPGEIEAGSSSDAIVSSVDFFPTLCKLAGASLPENQVIDGTNILPVLKYNQFEEERAIFWHYPVYHHMVPASAVRKGQWKLIHFLDDDHYELYNLKEDIGETNNVLEQNKEKANELTILLKQWREDVNARLPVKNPEFNPQKRYVWGTHPSQQ